MLRKLLRNISKAPESNGRGDSYADRLMARARAALEADIADLDAVEDPLERILDAVLVAEVQLGLADEAEVAVEKRRQFARSFLQLLLDNDALPLNMQLSETEIRKPRGLLEGFFLGTADVQREAQNVLQFIEKRFSEGHYAQAGLLLQLFDTEPTTRRNNERNLFYEQMIARFLHKRHKPVPSTHTEERDKVAEASLNAGDITGLVEWYAEHEVRFHVHVEPTESIAAWNRAFAEMRTPRADGAIRIVTPKRWRRPGSDLAADVLEHLNENTLRSYVQHVTRTIYFIVLATGRTGYEDLIAHFITWMDAHFDCAATLVLPDIHRMSTIENLGIGESIDTAYDRYLTESSLKTTFTAEEASEALGAVHERLATLDMAEIPVGDYDLGGLVMNHLCGLRFERFVDEVRQHRII